MSRGRVRLGAPAGIVEIQLSQHLAAAQIPDAEHAVLWGAATSITMPLGMG